MRLSSITPKIILDSRLEKTIEVSLTSGNFESKASVPCGKSKGEFEAFCHTAERSVELISEITPKFLKEDFQDQSAFDSLLLTIDGTENKSKLGVNVILSLSIAFCRLFAKANNFELYQLVAQLSESKPKNFPLVFFNLINGGLHVPRSFCPLPFQEYLLIPKSTSPKLSLELTNSFIEVLKQGIIDSGLGINYGDEGGFIISGEDPEIGFQHFHETVVSNKELFLDKVYFGLDVASSSLWRKEKSDYGWDNGLVQCQWSSEQLSDVYFNLATKYPLLSIEDPFEQNSWEQWQLLNQKLGSKVWLIGDDLTVTNVSRIKKAEENNAANAVLIKPNQIGTVSETIAAVKLAKIYGWKIVVSHRSGETNDSFISDFAFGISADGLKAGSPLQEERLVKYKRLIEIESSYDQTNVG